MELICLNCFPPSPCDRYGHFSGINRKVQLTYLPHGHPKAASEDEGKETWPLDMQAKLVTRILPLLTTYGGWSDA